jgi:hypothetical protein
MREELPVNNRLDIEHARVGPLARWEIDGDLATT